MMRLDPLWHELALGLLKDLVRIDTSNPPGREEEACERAAAALREHRVEPRIHRTGPGRANLTARVRGDGSAPPLLLAAHLDVVPADPTGWTHPPFSAKEADGCIWGRGTLDMKHMAALSVAVLCRLQQERPRRLRRDVVLALVADEETGMELGSRWLVDHVPDEVRAGVALGEIGGLSQVIAGRRIYPVQVAEKGTARLRLTARGRTGHGSIPYADSAPILLARAVAALGANPLPAHSTAATRAFVAGILEAIAPGLGFAAPLLAGDVGAALVRRFGSKSPLGGFMAAVLANTVSPTCLDAGKAGNVIPPVATAELDGRTLPGQTTGDLVREVRAVVGPEVEIEVRSQSPPIEAPLVHPFLDLLRDVLRAHDPDARLVPMLTPGYTDAKSWSRLGATCYGFTPIRFPDGFPAPSTLFHGIDERVPVEGFHFGLDLLAELVERWAGEEETR